MGKQMEQATMDFGEVEPTPPAEEAAQTGQAKVAEPARQEKEAAAAGLTYREASDQLEGIIRRLESNDLELEESLALYQRGVALVSDLRARLADASQRVTVLMGQIEAEDEEAHDTTLS